MESTEEKPKEEPTSEEKSEPEKLAERVASLEAERLALLKKELLEAEMRIDKKISEFKKFVENTEVQGRALAGNAVQESDEQKAKKAANSLIAGTGLSID